MKVTTLRLPEDLYDDLQAEAGERGLSFSEYVRQLLQERGEGANTDANTEVLSRLEELEDRVDALEDNDYQHSVVEDAADQETTEDGTEEPDVATLVDEHAAAEWDDSESRLRKRKAAARAVLQRAITDEAVGKSDVDDLFEEHAVPGQNKDTWWRNNCRDLLAEHGAYDKGVQGYRVDLGQSD